MTNLILIKDLVVGCFYKLPSGTVLKVEHLSWHTDGMHKGSVDSLVLIHRDGSKRNLSFLLPIVATNFIAVVDGFELNEIEIENKRLRKVLEFYAEELNWSGDEPEAVVYDKGTRARKALEVSK